MFMACLLNPYWLQRGTFYIKMKQLSIWAWKILKSQKQNGRYAKARASSRAKIKFTLGELVFSIVSKVSGKCTDWLPTWEKPCCRAQPAGSWFYWMRDPSTPGCVVWQCLVGCVTASCHWCEGQWDGLETTGLCWDSWLGLRCEKDRPKD